MQTSTRFTIAAHTLVCIAYFSPENKVTSDFIAKSVNVNPVVIRRTLGKLKEAGLVTVEAGVGGAHLAKDPADITLLDVFDAAEGGEKNIFAFHEEPNPNCPVGRNIHALIDGELDAAQAAMRASLAGCTLAELMERMEKVAVSA